MSIPFSKQTRLKISIQNLYFLLCIFGCIFPIIGFANLNIIELLPNPAGDDTLGEYIEIRNTGCESINLSEYHLFDASNKTYTFPNATIVNSHENIRLPYATTKIALNNSGIESITLTDSGGTLLDSYTYSGTQQDNIVILISSLDEECDTPSATDSNTSQTGSSSTGSADTRSTSTGSSDTGTTDSNSTDSGSSNTGSTNTNTGNTLSSNTGSSSSNSFETGSSNTGSSNTGASNTGIIFPDIFPTLQQPTNALFSGGVFDCTGQSPCRINITFDPIFTGGLLARNYVCEVITDTGSMTTCNPNTLYFSTGGSFIFHLSNKNNQDQYREIIYPVVYNFTNDSSGVTDDSLGSISGSGNTGSTNSGVMFPDIVPVFQNYTNTTNSGDTLTCITSPCRVNFTLDPIFTGAYISRDYICEVYYGTGIYSCNPPQLSIIGTGSILIEIIYRSTGEKISKELHIMENIIAPIVDNRASSVVSNSSIDTNPPILILEYDGKIKSYHEQIGDYEMNCYTSTCAINLSTERSYDPEGGAIRFLWYYGPNDIKTTKDPGERKYGLGDHEIWLRVIDTVGNVASVRYHIHVLGEREQYKQEKIDKKHNIKDIPIKNQSKKIKKQKKPKKIVFFDPPSIVLQNSKFVENNNKYACFTKTKKCNLNLEVSDPQKGIVYTWIYDDGEVITTDNPKSKTFTPGIHTVKLVAGYSSDIPLWTRDILVEVTKIGKTKKPKKIKKVKIVQNTGSNMGSKNDVIQSTDESKEQKNDDEFPYVSFALIGGILPILALRRILTGVIRKI